MNLAMAGINFRSAPVELREKVSFAPAAVPDVIRKMGAELPTAGIVVLSTCNRTEVYAVGDDRAELDEGRLIRAFLSAGGVADADRTKEHIYTETGLEAAQHLIAVAASLDSMVVGETEILGQVKQAYLMAAETQEDCGALHTLFQAALGAAKRVHAETDISRGRVSVSSIAVECAEKVFDSLSLQTVMVVGAGETSELTVKTLVEKGVTNLLVLNRSRERAEALAGQYGGRAVQFDKLAEFLPRADITISSTHAPHCVIGADSVRKAAEIRRGAPMLFIDIAVPRDIDPLVGDLENVYLYDIDDLSRVAEAGLARRQAAVEKAWRVVGEETRKLAGQLDSVSIEAVMRGLTEYGDSVRDLEVKRAFGSGPLASLPAEVHDAIRELAGRAVHRALARPRNALNRARKNGSWETCARAVKELFGLHGEKGDGDE